MFYKSYTEELLEGAAVLRKNDPKLEIFSDIYISCKHDESRKYLLNEMLKTVDNADLIEKILYKEYSDVISSVNIYDNDHSCGLLYVTVSIENINYCDSIENRMKILGWFLSRATTELSENYYIAHRNIEEAKNNKRESDTTISMFFEPMYDVELNLDGIEYLYHITFDVHYERIMKNGLTPRTQSKLATHPSRIYLLIDKYLIKSLADSLYQYNKNKLNIEKAIVFRIKTSDLVSRGVKIYDDINMPHGVYTNDNIPSESLEIYKEIYFK